LRTASEIALGVLSALLPKNVNATMRRKRENAAQAGAEEGERPTASPRGGARDVELNGTGLEDA
jgi:hypothetical protein